MNQEVVEAEGRQAYNHVLGVGGRGQHSSIMLNVPSSVWSNSEEVVAEAEHNRHHGCGAVNSPPSHGGRSIGSRSRVPSRSTTYYEVQEAMASIAAAPAEPERPGHAASGGHGSLPASSSSTSPLLPMFLHATEPASGVGILSHLSVTFVGTTS